MKIIASKVIIVLLMLSSVLSGQENNATKPFTFLGLPFGTPLASVQSNKHFKCKPTLAAMMCKATISDLGLKGVEYLDETYLFFYESKFVLATTVASSMDTPEKLEQKSQKIIAYMSDIFDIEHHKQEVGYSFRAKTTPEIYDATFNWMGVEVIFKVYDKKMIDTYQQARIKAKAQVLQEQKKEAKKQLQVFKP